MTVTGMRRSGGLTAAGAAIALLALGAASVVGRAPATVSHQAGTTGARGAGRSAGADAGLRAALGPGRGEKRAVSILQIGDSHTAADLFTGTVRQILQERYGRGGPGYLPVGTPHPGVRSTQIKLSASPGWSYEGLQRTPATDGFGLSGFNARTQREGESLTFASEAPVPYARIEIEVRREPGAGSIAVEVDGAQVLAASLAAGAAASAILTVRPPDGTGTFRRLILRTTSARPVTVASLGVYRPGTGLTYSSLGFPGATVDVLGRFPDGVLADTLRRLAPDLVVLAFGTNEGFDANLDPVAYRARYAAAVRDIRAAAPRARLVMIGPPQAERGAPACSATSTGPCAEPASPEKDAAPAAVTGACPRRPPQLDRVRAVQRRLAEAEHIPFWDWWAIMPPGCGAEAWLAADPPLMARDRVHFTKAGYRLSGQAFAAFLEPELRALLRGDDAVSND